MKNKKFDTEIDGFYGTYYQAPKSSDCAVIGLFGDDPNDYMAKCGAKWLHKLGVNVMAMSPAKKDYSHVNCPLERIETAIKAISKDIRSKEFSTAGSQNCTSDPNGISYSWLMWSLVNKDGNVCYALFMPFTDHVIEGDDIL